MTRIQITREQYNALKQRIEHDKAEEKEAFHIFHRNCSACGKILKDILEVEVNNREYREQVILRKVLYKLHVKSVNKTAVKILHYVACVIRFLIAPFWLLVWVGPDRVERRPSRRCANCIYIGLGYTGLESGHQ